MKPDDSALRLEVKSGRSSEPGTRRPRATAWFVALVAAICTLYLARPFLLPIAVAVLVAEVLRPMTSRLVRMGAHPPLAAALVVCLALATFAFGAYNLAAPATAWVQRAPAAFQRIDERLRSWKQPLAQLSQATSRMTRLASIEEPPAATPRADLLGATQAMALELATIVFLVYFLLASGDFFARRMIELLPAPEHQDRTLRCVAEVRRQIAVYFSTVTTINFCLGAAASFILWLCGMPNPVLFGVMLGALTYVPYVGPLIGHVIIAAVAFVSLDDIALAAAAPLSCLLLSAIEGQLVTPLVLGRNLSLNPVVIFVGLMFWTWVWGLAGTIVAVPFLMMAKIVCADVAPLHGVARLLGSYPTRS